MSNGFTFWKQCNTRRERALNVMYGFWLKIRHGRTNNAQQAGFARERARESEQHSPKAGEAAHFEKLVEWVPIGVQSEVFA